MQRDLLTQQLRNELDWLTSRRWFGDKARPVTDIRVLLADSADVDGERVFLILVEFTHQWGDPTLYFVPFLEGDGSLAERDITAMPHILRWIAEGFAVDRVIEGEGTWKWRSVGQLMPNLSEVESENIRLISGEQSNSSVLYGDRAIGKLFRRVQPGINPDLEIGEHLMAAEDYQSSPALYGVIELEWEKGRIDIAALQEYVPNEGDGWSWLLGQLIQPVRRENLLEPVRQLGTRTGEMHLALSNQSDNPAFAPEEIGENEAQAIIRRVISEMEASVEGLTHHLQSQEIERLHKGLGTMMGDAWSLVGTMLIRVHGDYHLGQTLRTSEGDFAIIDFEGEPSRTMEERRRKLPALKDVAGMVRSLDYAGATLLQQTEDPQERAEVAGWVNTATEVYIAAYRKAIAESELPLVPGSDEAFASVLNLMIAEKALYELRYEMNNRPEWLWIPLGALLRLVGMEEND